MNRQRLIGLAFCALALLLFPGATSCWQPILDGRSCVGSELTLTPAGDQAFIPNCFGAELQTIPTRETVTVTLSANVTLTRVSTNLTDSFLLTRTPAAVEGDSEVFTFQFAPNFDGPTAANHMQTFQVLVYYGAPTSTSCHVTPIPRISASHRLGSAVEGFLGRCNPELEGDDAIRLSEVIFEGDSALEDLTTAYDATAAARCACDIHNMPCDSGDPFRAIQSCIDTVQGVVPNGSPCQTHHQCQSESCPVEPGTCGGTCEPMPAIGADCVSDMGTAQCPMGSYCESFCLALPGAGEACNFNGLCAGNFDYLVFQNPTCDNYYFTCGTAGRQGDPCLFEACSPTYTCGEAFTCEPKPTTGEACSLPVDLPAEALDPSEWETTIAAAGAACRLGVDVTGDGDYCVQTGATTGVGTCTQVPGLNEPCGLGPGLSARCGSGLYCGAINFNLLEVTSGVCIPIGQEGESCPSFWFEDLLGAQCGPHMACDFHGVCVCSY